MKSRRERNAAVAEDVCKDQSEKNHKSDLWYRQLPSQTAQETCKLLDKAWKSFYALKKSEGVREPNPLRFKKQNMRITYMQMGIVHETGTDRIRLSLPKELKIYMEKEYGTRLEKQKESYSSQCSPVSPEVSKKYAEPSNRKKRGLYVAGKKETAVRNRTETAPNNKSSCVAKKQAVVVAWTHPEKCGIPL